MTDGYRQVAELSRHSLNSDIYGEEEDVSDLVRSIEEDGFSDHDPILITPDGTILSGHRRWKAAKEVGLESVPVRVEDTDDEVKTLLRQNQYRTKTPGQKINEGLQWEKILEDSQESGKTRDLVGEHIGMSGRNYSKGKKVKTAAEFGAWGDKAVPEDVREKAREMWDALKSDDVSIHAAYSTVKDAINEGGKSSTSEGSKSPSNDESERGKSSTSEQDGFPVNLGWLGKLQGERAEAARSIGSDQLRDVVVEYIQDGVLKANWHTDQRKANPYVTGYDGLPTVTT